MGAFRAAAAVVAGVLAGSAGAPALADTSVPSLIDRTEWVRYGDSDGLSSLRVYPTPSARSAAAQPGTQTEADQAWQEVLAAAPGADTPGMREQFLCHWKYAEFAWPGKTSWNLEPWRPVVDDVTMLASGCNPGAPEENL